MILEILEGGMREGGWGMQDSACFFKAKEIQKKKITPLPLNISGAEFSGFFSCFALFCFVFQVSFSEIFLKCTFYKVYQVFSYLKPNVNRSL